MPQILLFVTNRRNQTACRCSEFHFGRRRKSFQLGKGWGRGVSEFFDKLTKTYKSENKKKNGRGGGELVNIRKQMFQMALLLFKVITFAKLF